MGSFWDNSFAPLKKNAPWQLHWTSQFFSWYLVAGFNRTRDDCSENLLYGFVRLFRIVFKLVQKSCDLFLRRDGWGTENVMSISGPELSDTNDVRKEASNSNIPSHIKWPDTTVYQDSNRARGQLTPEILKYWLFELTHLPTMPEENTTLSQQVPRP